jgi:Uroporphyrinogen decarboxylase (URO-D)
MKLSLALLGLLASLESTSGFSVDGRGTASGTSSSRLHSATAAETVAASTSSASAHEDPLLIRAARGEKVERTPVWMMRQAGRHIKEYRDLCEKYPTFRQRSEIAEVAVEVSLQPWRNYQTDGCILFSDILTPLPGIGADFVIDEKRGPIMTPMRSWDDIKKVSPGNRPAAASIKQSSNSTNLYSHYIVFSYPPRPLASPDRSVQVNALRGRSAQGAAS